MNKFWKVVGCLIVGSILGNIYSYVKDTNERVKKIEKSVCPPAIKEEEKEPKETKTDESSQKVDECRKQVFPDKEELNKEEKKETTNRPFDLSNINEQWFDSMLPGYYERWFDSMLPGLGKEVMNRYDISVSEKPLHKEDK